MHRQIVRRAGAERETLWVLLAAGLILATATAAVGLRPAPEAEAAPAAHQIDSRTALTAAEQGLHADLKMAAAEIAVQIADEIAALRKADGKSKGRAPSPAELAAQALPPFAADASAAARGGHAWTLVEAGGTVAYAGLSADPGKAGSLLLLLDRHGDGDGHGPGIWLKRAAEAPPARLDEASLAAAGWKRITSTFTAGVTR